MVEVKYQLRYLWHWPMVSHWNCHPRTMRGGIQWASTKEQEEAPAEIAFDWASKKCSRLCRKGSSYYDKTWKLVKFLAMKAFCSMAKISRRKILLNIICNVYQDVTDDSWIPEARSPHRDIHNDHQWLFKVDPLLIPSLIVKKQPRCKSELLHGGDQATKAEARWRKWRGR